jgi:catechol 2,3-dioxygenase-like lactoylglutathione lyase family enzyme
MITGISIVAVPVDDIDEALHFYCDLLGMEKRKTFPRPRRAMGAT